ncbi:class I SAM-dependent methyltransferase [Microbacterium sp. H1-D42]|uniref:class I SAM-dependent methyltransferase n=1 Tax=Microbacterium sp. H1-D42 TaxID=2925844 RepID=UPI001F53D786|nr:class I SAM-dependent methyltransferase [Microbacterium sp. H1-D42]UNK69295.1 class I SAM-dependent methyltransferase [Microbacterium sp. H1-D42]
MNLLAALTRFNEGHPWSHNDAFSGFVLGQARAVRRVGGRVAVDVGCGTGGLVARLAAVFPTVIGIEPDAETAAVAKRRLARTSDARIEQRAFGSESPETYDLIVFVASLHHMPLRETLLKARAALRPGGRIVIVGVARETSADAARSLVSVVLNPLVGLVRHPRRAVARPTHMRAPVAEPRESFDEIGAVAEEVLPGIRLRRRLFWRYTAVWAAPTAR